VLLAIVRFIAIALGLVGSLLHRLFPLRGVFRERKHIEKLRYMHRNPVKRGLVASPELWRWSSYRYCPLGERGPVKVDTLCSERKNQNRALRKG